MTKPQSLEEFYRHKKIEMPETLNPGLGHFNVFRMESYVGPDAKPLPYARKEFYKVSLIVGRNRYNFADKVIETAKYALMFANPQVPYMCEPMEEEQSGYFAIFTESFFPGLGATRLTDYPIFKPGGAPVMALPADQVPAIEAIFEKMLAEKDSDYQYKYDLLRSYLTELIHIGMKLQPQQSVQYNSNASNRIANLFEDLLERQFPIESMQQQVNFRTANDYALQLSIHVNHLNKALKDTKGKSTSELISDRIVQEAKMLLKHTTWNISEIGYCLGFLEPAHFNNFFKKKTQLTPRSFRSVSE